MQVLEAREVAADDDQVHAPLVLDVEVAHGLAALVDDPEAELGRRPRRARSARGRSGSRPLRPRARARARCRAAAMPAVSVAPVSCSLIASALLVRGMLIDARIELRPGELAAANTTASITAKPPSSQWRSSPPASS